MLELHEAAWRSSETSSDNSITLQVLHLFTATSLAASSNFEGPATVTDGVSSVSAEDTAGLMAKPADHTHFVDKHRADLIQRISNIDPILDQLLGSVIQQEAYDRIRAQPTSQDKGGPWWRADVKT
ncbi:apoptosis-associated speck-like protein containing a CARD [Parambassis ranga]|uniref:Apoptosis-associated speck-like protein containing a CARD n=1 Tax=Parambassis ranga TaxID=210632 RepID=A0A6P7HV05_9TELE|nr:apoptosis-associated speck-like protein containing a CARD [Parambassis ranga]